MSYVIEVPVEGGGRLVVQAGDDDPDELQLAARRPGEAVAHASESVEQALKSLRPAIRAVRSQLEAMAPDETTVEFGILLGAETGVIVAKGTAEVHFTVTLTWKNTPSTESPHAPGSRSSRVSIGSATEGGGFQGPARG